MDPVFGIKFFGALFAIMNPLTNLPIFLSLTGGMDLAEQRRTALQVLLYSTVMCAIVAVAGQQILNFFTISIDAFRVAGGVVLAGIAINLLNGHGASSHRTTTTEHEASKDLNDHDVAFFPLTFPMIVGPGSITTLIVFLHQASGVRNYLAYAAVVAVVLGLLGLTFYFAGDLDKRLSLTLRAIMTRVMGMILLAIAIGMLAEGLLKLLPGLGAAA
jgi:multiple antibiotic resistance protein